MLKELRLTNFRAFDDEVTLRLRPITVLIGRNNAGKSSLIKFILMLQQSLDPALPAFIDSDGSRVKLGAFHGLRHSRSKRRTLYFTMRFETSDIPGTDETQNMRSLLRASYGSDAPRTIHGIRLPPEDGAQSGPGPVRQRVAQYELRVQTSYGGSVQRGRQEIDATVANQLIFKGTTTNLSRGGLLTLPPEGRSYGALAGAFVAERFLQPLRYEISSIRHLGPIRVESQRAIVSATPPDDDVGQQGEFALPHLHGILSTGGKRAAFVLRHFKAVAGIDELRFEKSGGKYLVFARAKNCETNAWAYLSDFGFGVSQCLPVFVQGALMPQNHLLMVEQPEAQLHPTAQLDVGEFFADLWRERRVASLVETHSSNIILRIRHLIAMGKLEPADVSIGFIVAEKGTTIIKNLDIGPDGSIEKGLPMEFFGQDIIEGIRMGAKK